MSRLARELLPAALAAKPESDAGRAAQAMLRGWKGEMSTGLAAPLVFAAWYRELTRLVYADELGELFNDAWEIRAAFMIPVMKAERGYERWCDDVRTPTRETCAMLSARAFDLAAANLEKRYGASQGWRWGVAHPAAGDHRPFGFVPSLARFFNVAPETAGDAYAINVGAYTMRDEQRPFANRHAPSLRAIYDLADPQASLFIHSGGQSGNPLSSHYRAFAAAWARGEYIPMLTDRRRLEAAGVQRLALAPRK